MIAAGRLRHRIDLDSRAETQADTGDLVSNWSLFAADVPAEIAPASAREFTAANTALAQATAKITIRWRPGMGSGAKMRARHKLYVDGVQVGEDTYNILGALPDAETGRSHFILYCTKGTNEG